MSSLTDLKAFFESTKTNSEHLSAPKEENSFMEDVIDNSEVKDLTDASFLEHIEPSTTEFVDFDDHPVAIYPYDEPSANSGT